MPTTTLITGATRGVGRETARRLVAEGHDVIVGARDAERGAQVADELGARSVVIDVTDDASVRAAVDAVRESGGLDVLVNNAGISGEQTAPDEQTIEDLEHVLATNVVGATRVLRAFTPLLEESDAPVVVDVSSAVGSLGRNSSPDGPWQLLAYPMSKAALNMLTIQFAKAHPRWRVNSVTPGLTNTDFISADVGRPVEEGAEIVVQMATIGPDGPTGTFVEDSGPVPW